VSLRKAAACPPCTYHEDGRAKHADADNALAVIPAHKLGIGAYVFPHPHPSFTKIATAMAIDPVLQQQSQSAQM
jgi:hypothetical protein